MKLDVNRIFPNNPSRFNGFRTIRIVTALYMFVMLVRSCIHLFASDGGAQSIAGIDITVAGGENIVAIFHQWGAIQLILIVLLYILFFRYPGFTPLILATLAIEPVMRFISGRISPVIAEGTPPGEKLNWLGFLLVISLFIASLIDRNPRKNNL
jgi:hypothetical protein